MASAGELIARLAEDESLILAVFSDRRKKSDPVRKVTLRPVKTKAGLLYQAESTYDKKVTHQNILPSQAGEFAAKLIQKQFKKAEIFSKEADYSVLANKPDNARITRKNPTKQLTSFAHNRTRVYAIPEGQPVDFLVCLGVMTPSGEVLPTRRAKFRQINKFLEIVQGCMDQLPESPVIIDFGCGKSYLTFALYYYLNIKNQLNAKIIGLDLKEDVIAFCAKTAEELGYDGLTFLTGDIADYTGSDHADMVVTLHACDMATDYALQKAKGWDARVILSVPCCQHELNAQIERPDMNAFLSHGILKERFSAILTDALRAEKLTEWGYKVDLVEFTTLEHTAKNIMLRCIRGGVSEEKRCKAAANFDAQCAYWHVDPAIGRENF